MFSSEKSSHPNRINTGEAKDGSLNEFRIVAEKQIADELRRILTHDKPRTFAFEQARPENPVWMILVRKPRKPDAIEETFENGRHT